MDRFCLGVCVPFLGLGLAFSVVNVRGQAVGDVAAMGGSLVLPEGLEIDGSRFTLDRLGEGNLVLAFTAVDSQSSTPLLVTSQIFEGGLFRSIYGNAGFQTVTMSGNGIGEVVAQRYVGSSSTPPTGAVTIVAVQKGDDVEFVLLREDGTVRSRQTHVGVKVKGFAVHEGNTVTAFGSRQTDQGWVGFVDDFWLSDGSWYRARFPRLTPELLEPEGVVDSGTWASEVSAVSLNADAGNVGVGSVTLPGGGRQVLFHRPSVPGYPAGGSSIAKFDLVAGDLSFPKVVSVDGVREHLIHLESPAGGGAPFRVSRLGELDAEFSLPADRLPAMTETGLLEDELMLGFVYRGSRYMQVRKQRRADGVVQLEFVRFDWAGNPDLSLGADGKKVVSFGALRSIEAVRASGQHLYVVGTDLGTDQMLRLVAFSVWLLPDEAEAPLVQISGTPDNMVLNVGEELSVDVLAEQGDSAEEIPLRYFASQQAGFATSNWGPSSLQSGVQIRHDGVLTSARARVQAMSVRASNGVRVAGVPLTVTMRRPPFYSSSIPAVHQVLKGQPLRITLPMNGGLPYLSKWVKLGSGETLALEPLPESESHSIVQEFFIANVKPEDAGVYQFQFSNPDGVAEVMETEVLVINDPSLIGTSGSRLMAVGEQDSLWVTATSGYPSIRYSWTKNGKRIQETEPGHIEFESVQLRDAGRYRAVARSAAGTVRSPTLELAVVNTGNQLGVARVGSRVALRVAAAGDGLVYHWYRGEQLLTESSSLAGVESGTLRFSAVEAGDAGEYRCQVSGHGRTLEVPFELVLVNDRPTVLTQTLPPADVARWYTTQLEVATPASRYMVSGLPKGLKVNSSTGEISGMARRAGRYRLRVVAVNPVGRSRSQQLILDVRGLGEGLVGEFRRADDIRSTPNFGVFQAHVTRTGAFSGRLVYSDLDGRQFTLKQRGVLSETTFGPEVLISPRSPLGLPISRGYEGYQSLSFQGGQLVWEVHLGRRGSEEFETVELTGSHCPKQSDALFAGSYNLAGIDREVQSGDEPFGYSFARVQVSRRGAVRVAAVLSDGTRLSEAGTLNAQNHLVLGRFLYGNSGRHAARLNFSMEGEDELAGRKVMAGGIWTRGATNSPKKDNHYPNGFDLRLAWAGGIYDVGDVMQGRLLMGASEVANNIEGNLSTGEGLQRRTLATLTRRNRAETIDAGMNFQDEMKRVQINPKTGTFRGVWRLVDEDESGGIRTREDIPFSGLLVSDGVSGAVQGLGFGRLRATTIFNDALGRTIDKQVLRGAQVEMDAIE
jgi:hypothetical protein